jgi:hypothetical protein
MPGVKWGTYAVPRAELGEAFREYRANRADLIGLQALPILGVRKQAATMSVRTRESMLKPADTKRAKGGSYNRIGIEGEDLAYSCEEHGLEGKLSDTDRAKYASDFDAELATMEETAWKLLLAQEERIETLLFNTSTWTGSQLYTDNSAAPWDAAASDAIGHVTAAKEKVREMVGMDPDTLIIGKKTLNNLKANTAVIARLQYVTRATQEEIVAAMAAMLGVERILVGSAVYDSADEGQDTTIGDIWGDDYAMVAVTGRQGDSLITPCVGRTVLWTDDAPENETVESYREEQTRSEVYRVRQHVDELVFDKYFAHLMKVDA